MAHPAKLGHRETFSFPEMTASPNWVSVTSWEGYRSGRGRGLPGEEGGGVLIKPAWFGSNPDSPSVSVLADNFLGLSE